MCLFLGSETMSDFFQKSFLLSSFVFFRLSIMSTCYYKNRDIRQYKWHFLKAELRRPSLSSGLIKRGENLVETDSSKDKCLTFVIGSLSLFPSSHTNTCSSPNTTPSPTLLGLCTCCSSAWTNLSSTAYLENFHASFKIPKRALRLLCSCFWAASSSPSIV